MTEKKIISSIGELNQLLDENASQAEALYEKSLEFRIENTQEFINWQDRLNRVSIIPEDKIC